MKRHKSPTPPAGKLRPQAEKRLKRKSLGGTAELQRSPVRLAHEIEKRKRVEEDGAKQLRFETLLADLSSKFVNLPAGEVDREIMEAERRLCEFLGVDFAALWQLSDETLGYFTVTHVYSVQKGSQESLGRMKVEDFPWFLQEMLAGRIVNLPSLEEMPAEADHDRESCRRLGIKSNLCLPLSVLIFTHKFGCWIPCDGVFRNKPSRRR